MSWDGMNSLVNLGDGSNLKSGANPAYAVSDFTTFYPQFGNDSSGNPVVPTAVMTTFITMANAQLQSQRWQTAWSWAMGLFVAHYCTLWLQASTSPDNGGGAVGTAGGASGVVTSKSAGGVSQSRDPKLPGADSPLLAGWGDLHLTKFGQQLLSRARIVVAEVNAAMPQPRASYAVPYERLDYVVETERRFYLANEVSVSVQRDTTPPVIELDLTDAWVWDMSRPARFVPSARVITFRDVNVERLTAKDL